MPNHVVNEVRLHGVSHTRLRPLIAGPTSGIDFEVLVPLPINYWPGNASTEHEKAFPGTHLDAARTTWGTKWNAYAVGDHSVRADGDDMVLTFETAWSPPRGWVVALFNTLHCRITHHWQSEGNDRVMVDTYSPDSPHSGGPRWECSEVPYGGADYRRLYALQWGAETPEELHADE